MLEPAADPGSASAAPDRVPAMRRVRGDLYELRGTPSDRRLWNPDLAPTRVEQRTWTTYNMASLWIGLSVCIPTYMLAAGLIQGGMSWWQAMLTILLGNLIVLVPMVLIAHPGTRFGIPFPVLARASFGTRGANVPGPRPPRLDHGAGRRPGTHPGAAEPVPDDRRVPRLLRSVASPQSAEADQEVAGAVCPRGEQGHAPVPLGSGGALRSSL